MNSKIGVGVLGYGLAGRYFHVPFIQESSEFDLRAVATSRTYAHEQLPNVRITDVDGILNADDIANLTVEFEDDDDNSDHEPRAGSYIDGGDT